jgi:hypothetical protein
MKNNNHSTPLEYFNSINNYGIVVPIKGTDHHDIKFCCKIESAGKIIREFRAALPHLTQDLIFHVNKENTKVLFGGRFHNNSRVKNFLYDLIAKHK